ncbi:MAG: alanine--tRNA ligase [Candidatus Magasanikbacteria bacterium]
MITSHELRTKYLEFFKSKGHVVIPSASLLPENDPTTLFTGSGMQPMVPYLLGQTHPLGTRIADSQKAFRTQDVDEVGDNRHTTFFEMLGNWSLGDYFKNEQIPWMFEFLIKELKLDPQRIYASCFRGKEDIGIPQDEESAKLWQKQFASVGIDAPIVNFPEKDGMQNGRIFYYDAKKNWWSRAGVPDNMPVGEPGGPDSEMFWDFGSELQLHEKSEWKDKPCHINCDCGRFTEIGNNVFMAYKKTEKGFELLEHKNVDFGGGLERLATAINDNPDIFLIDLFKPIREKLEAVSGKTYGENPDETKAFRIIMDHMRATTFLICDGAVPSNKDQGYFTRRWMRRMVRFADGLGIKNNFCSQLAEAVIEEYKTAYPDLLEKKQIILAEMEKEENKFRNTLAQGLKEFEQRSGSNDQGTMINGREAFDLYQSYGFPLEMTIELAQEKGKKVDVNTFNEEMKKHQELSRLGSEHKFKGGLADTGEMSVKYHTATHLLHAALRKVLGEHVAQKGSNITAERLRFDFSHPDKMTEEQKKQVEDLVNSAIQKDYSVTFVEMSVHEAKELGAIGLFGDKYGDKVKVYSVGDPTQKSFADVSSPTFSKEICGGPHVEHTGVLGHFKIQKEEASSAGVRRIKALLTG